MSPADSSDRQKRVAVIAVHGVGYTPPGATAKHLSDLLLGIGRLKLDGTTDWPGKDPLYGSFQATPLVVPLKRPFLTENDRDGAQSRVATDQDPKIVHAFHAFDERLGYLAKAFRRAIPAKQVVEEVRADHGKIAQEFMRVQLAYYLGQAQGQAYDTVCLEGQRLEEGKPGVPVDIYESYWADLSHPKNNILSFFLAFYQLVFHLSSLSRTAVYYAALEHMTDWRWRVVSFLQAFASRLIALPIPILNLLMLLAGASVLPLKLSATSQKVAALVAGAIFCLAAVLVIRNFLSIPKSPPQWLTLLSISLLLGAAIAYALSAGEEKTKLVLGIEWWILGGAILSQLFKRYDRVRRSALATGLTLLFGAFLVFCYFLHFTDAPGLAVEQASLWTIQLLMGAVVLCWTALIASALLLWLFGSICVYWQKPETREKAKQGETDAERNARKQSEEEIRGRARAALRTGRLALATSASTFLLVTIFLWSGIFYFGSKKWNLYSEVTPKRPPIHGWMGEAFSYVIPDPCVVEDWITRIGYSPSSDSPRLITDFVWGLLLIGVTSGLPAMLVLSGTALIILVSMITPSLVLPRDRLNKFGDRITSALGNWYSHGLDSTMVVTALLWHSIFTTAAVFGLLDFLYCHDFHSQWPYFLLCALKWSSRHTLQMLSVAAGGLAVSGAAIAALALKYGKAPLDIVLDVDNYLRTSPLANTPRACIVERFVSLLRYIAAKTGADQKPYYTDVVIAAHSLGALISLDLLHFLKREGDPALARLGFGGTEREGKPPITISLLTFGNPIRQLLNRFFPHLYWWVNAEPDNSIAPLPSAVSDVKQVDFAQTPTLDQVHLRSWVNAYRSGDFVGRSVWLNNWYRRSDPAGNSPAKSHAFSTVAGGTELCIGAGGHNDYWNRSAPDIAVQLNQLIAAVTHKT
jgi:hypothetical protein